jgi:hypothetical protein
MDGSKTSGVFPVSLMRLSGLSVCSSLGGLFVKLLAGRDKRMRYEVQPRVCRRWVSLGADGSPPVTRMMRQFRRVIV